MIIEENDFRLTPVDSSSQVFDLELLYKIQPKGKEARYEFKQEAFGISLESAIKRIAQFRVNNKYESISLTKYFNEFRNELNEIKKLLN